VEDTGSAKRTACLCCVLVFEKECLTLPCGADTCLCQTQASAKRTARVCCVLLVCLWSCSTLPGGSDRPRISNPSCTSHNHAPPQTRTGLGVWHAHTHTHTLTHTRNPGPPSPALTHVFRTQAAPHITTPLHKPAQGSVYGKLTHTHTHTHTLTHARNPGPPSPALTHVFRTQAAPHITTPLHKPAQGSVYGKLTHTHTHARNPGPPSPALTHVFRTQAAPHITTPLHKPAQARCTACSHAHKALAHPSTHTHHPPRGVEKSRRPQLHCTARSGSTTTHTHTHTQTATARCLRQNTASQEEGA